MRAPPIYSNKFCEARLAHTIQLLFISISFESRISRTISSAQKIQRTFRIIVCSTRNTREHSVAKHKQQNRRDEARTRESRQTKKKQEIKEKKRSAQRRKGNEDEDRVRHVPRCSSSLCHYPEESRLHLRLFYYLTYTRRRVCTHTRYNAKYWKHRLGNASERVAVKLWKRARLC